MEPTNARDLHHPAVARPLHIEVADLHLSLRPGTDAFLLGAMLAMILQRGGEAGGCKRRAFGTWEALQAGCLRLIRTYTNHAVADQIALELCDRRQDVEQQASRRRRRVDLLIERDEILPKRGELSSQRDEMVHTPCEPIELDAEDHIDLPLTHVSAQGIERRAPLFWPR